MTELADQKPTRPKWKTWQYWLRLSIFAVFVGILTIAIGQIVFIHLETDAKIKPAPSNVSLPDNFPAEEITFVGGDDLVLAAWYAASENGTVIILLHGYDANRTQLIWHAQQLIEAGFGVLMVDLRGHGESEGEQRTYGWRDVEDVAGAVNFLADKADRIGIYGFSVGGQIALRAAANIPTIQAVFVDGPSFATSRDLPSPANIQEVFVFGLAPIGDRMLSDRTNTPIPPSVMESLPKIAPRPIFFVATVQHPQIPGGEARMIRPYYERTEDHAQWWEIRETGHGGGWNARPDEYARNLIEFFEANAGSG